MFTYLDLEVDISPASEFTADERDEIIKWVHAALLHAMRPNVHERPPFMPARVLAISAFGTKGRTLAAVAVEDKPAAK